MIDLQKLLDRAVVRTTEVEIKSMNDTAKIRALSSKEVRDAQICYQGRLHTLTLDENGQVVAESNTREIDLVKLFDLKLTYIYHGMLAEDGSQLFESRSALEAVVAQLSDEEINEMYSAVDLFTNGKQDVEEVEKN